MYTFFTAEPMAGMIMEGEIGSNSEYVLVRGPILSLNHYRGIYSIELNSPIYNTIVFNLNEDVFVFDQQAEKLISQSDLQLGMEVIVIMNKDAIMTMSIPPQTPDAVAIIVKNMDVNQALNVTSVVTYCGLKEAVHEKGYQIEWKANDNPITLTKNNIKVELMIGSDEFGFTHKRRSPKALDNMQKLEGPPILYQGEAIVPKSFVDALE